MGDTGVILAAAGQGKRMQQGINKIYLDLLGQPVIKYSLDVFEDLDDVEEIVIVAHPGEIDFMQAEIVDRYNFKKVSCVIPGGQERQDSVWAGLQALQQDLKLVAVHDAARPLVAKEMAARTIQEARGLQAVCPGVLAKDTLRDTGLNGVYGKTLDRSRIYQIQTPQVFRLDALKEVYKKARKEGFCGTDDSSLFERYAGPVHIAAGEYSNIKITTVEDLDLARGILTGRDTMRVGSGYDVHRLVEGRDLVIGGVKIPWDKGLLGHSDADVLVHAICDALLGAAGLGDIGRHFPDNDPNYHNIDSLILLRKTSLMLAERGFAVVNMDSTIIAEQPKMAPHIGVMRGRIADALQIDPTYINIKATTTEGLGFTGREEGIAAQSTVLLRRI
ncbi:MAG: 2-C-methyl-D-erythritol 2,4-cyclodiphosphate synthase [Ignavibacteriales bacterium]